MVASILPPALPETLRAPRDHATEDARAVEALDALAHDYKRLLERLCASRELDKDRTRQVLRHVDELAYRVRASALDLGFTGAETVATAILEPRMVSRDEAGRWPGGGH